MSQQQGEERKSPRGLALMPILEDYIRSIIAQELEDFHDRLIAAREFYSGFEIKKLREELREAGVLPREEME